MVVARVTQYNSLTASQLSLKASTDYHWTVSDIIQNVYTPKKT